MIRCNHAPTSGETMIVTQRAGTATPRNRTVDVARGVGITLMVFGHVVDGLALQDALDPGFVH
jgi:uncharacterized membrane protein